MYVLSAREVDLVVGGQNAGGQQVWDDPATQEWLSRNPDHPLNDPAYRASVENLQASNGRMIDSMYGGAYDGANYGSSIPGNNRTQARAGAWGAVIGAIGGFFSEVFKGPVDKQEEKSTE